MYCNLKGVIWADITGDGRDDLLCVGPDGALTAWQNTAGSDARAPSFSALGIVKTSECTQAQVRNLHFTFGLFDFLIYERANITIGSCCRY